MISREELYDLYWGKGMSITGVADFLDKSRNSIVYWLKKYGIERRPPYIVGVGENHPRYRHDIKERSCEYCGEMFRSTPYATDHDGGRFCSKECFDKFRDTRIKVNCFNCGEDMLVQRHKYLKNKRFFCSKKCEGKYNHGDNNPFYGKTHTEKTREKMSENHADVSGENNPFYGKHHTEEALKKFLKSLRLTPNKDEQKLSKIIQKHAFPFRYVGDGQVTLGNFCPDFIECNGKKQIIELFGEPYHDPSKSWDKKIDWKRQEFGRKAIYSQLGYDTLIIWSAELKNENAVAERIREFMEGSKK